MRYDDPNIFAKLIMLFAGLALVSLILGLAIGGDGMLANFFVVTFFGSIAMMVISAFCALIATF